MTAAHVQDFVKTLTVGHECPLFSHQHSCRLVSPAPFTSIQIRIQQLISTTCVKHLHFRQLPRLTASRPLAHEEPTCVQQLRRWFQCGSNEPSSSVQLLVCLSLTSLSLHRHGHHSAQETRNQQSVGQLSVSRPAALEPPSSPLTRQQVTSSISCENCSVRPPIAVSDLSQICMSGFTCRQLINLVH